MIILVPHRHPLVLDDNIYLLTELKEQIYQ